MGTRTLLFGAVASAGLLLGLPRVSGAEDEEPHANPPELSRVFPPGITAGGTTRWQLVGRDLSRIKRFLISGSDVSVLEVQTRVPNSCTLLVRAGARASPGFRALRAEEAGGLSNALWFRVDRLAQGVEREPNDTLADATATAFPGSAAGVLNAGDIDMYQFSGRARQRLTVEVETKRLGTAINPVVTLFSASGSALAQAREARGCAGDARVQLELPADGTYYLQLRDALYAGGTTAVYRLRLHNEAFTTAVFPLGGPAGGTLNVSLAGGNLPQPGSARVWLPARPGMIVPMGTSVGEGSSLALPQSLIAGDGPEVFEASAGPDGHSTAELALGATANGRIAAPGEVDRYRLSVREGEKLALQVRAGSLGSWLDAVVRVRDVRGRLLAENDDPPAVAVPSFGSASALADPGATDSRLEHVPDADGTLVAEITDRFGNGGAEYAYRLYAGPPRADFFAAIVLEAPDGGAGSLNVSAGTSLRLRVYAIVEGRAGPIAVRALGLPEGIRAEPLTLKATPGARTPGGIARSAVSGMLTLEAAPGAPPAIGLLRVEATASNGADGTVTHLVPALVKVPWEPPGLPSRAVEYSLDEVPIMLVGARGRGSAR